jgi:hypothetical protein
VTFPSSPSSSSRRKQRHRHRIADLDESLDRGGDRFWIRVAQESAEELGRPRLRDFRDQIRELGKRGAPDRQTIERALHAKRDLLEALIGKPFEGLARRVPSLRLVVSQKIDQEIDRRPAVQLAGKRGDAD